MYIIVVTNIATGNPAYSFSTSNLKDAYKEIEMIATKREFGNSKYMFSIFKMNENSKTLIDKFER